jgi:disease resistance protein RPM1
LDEPLDLHSLNPAPQRLERLYLRGQLLNLPSWIFSLRNLVRIRLRRSKLSEDSVKELQSLPVIELALIQAYDGESLHFSEGFSRLQILEIDHLTNLEHICFREAMPKIQKMSIRSCEKLNTIPDGIEGLKHLKEIHLFAMPEAMVSSLKEGGADKHKVEHVPVIRIYNEHRDISSIIL